MLILNTENYNFMYLQDLIQVNFVDHIRQNYSIESKMINEISKRLMIIYIKIENGK